MTRLPSIQCAMHVHTGVKPCQYMLLYITILHEYIVSVIRHIQLSNMGPVPKWSDKRHSTVHSYRYTMVHFHHAAGIILTSNCCLLKSVGPLSFTIQYFTSLRYCSARAIHIAGLMASLLACVKYRGISHD